MRVDDGGWLPAEGDGAGRPSWPGHSVERSVSRSHVSMHLARAASVSGRMARALGRGLLGFALPPTCAACGAVMVDDGGLCPVCWRRLRFITAHAREGTEARHYVDWPRVQHAPGHLPRSKMPNSDGHDWGAGDVLAGPVAPPAFGGVCAAVWFNEVARTLVHGLKYEDRLDMARPMAHLMAQSGHHLLGEADMLIPVPLHPLRLWQRRFNQSAMLARHIHAVRLRMGRAPTVRMDILRRRRNTASQTKLDRAQRRDNVAGAFALSRMGEMDVRMQHVVLVDDVYTTGATLEACALALLQAGAGRVDALTFARVDDADACERHMTESS